eukprot:1285485-Rhodomonas_salina.1
MSNRTSEAGSSWEKVQFSDVSKDGEGITPSRAAAALLGVDATPVEPGSGSPRQGMAWLGQYAAVTPGAAMEESRRLECKWCSKTIRSNQVQAAKQCGCGVLIVHKACWKAIQEQI